MNLKTRFFIFAIALLSLSSIVKSQDYTTSAGLRMGYYNGLTLKHFVNENAAFEGILSTGWRGAKITGLYEIHRNDIEIEGFRWYFGFGAHVAFWNSAYYYRSVETTTEIGVDGILGLEYVVPDYPINVSLDWNPSIALIGISKFYGDGIALSVRYIL